MKSIEEIVFDGFLDEEVHDDLDYSILLEETTLAEKEFTDTLSPQQMNLYSAFVQVRNQFDAYNQDRLVRFVLSFIRSIFKPQ